MACLYYYEGNTYTKEQLLQLIKENKIPSEVNLELLPTQKTNLSDLRKVLGLGENTSLEDFISYSYPEFIELAKQFGLQIKYSFNEESPTSIKADREDDKIIMSINISLSEVFREAAKNKIDLKSFFKYQVEHELGHAVSLAALVNPEMNKVFTQFLNYAREVYVQYPFEDGSRANVVDEYGFPRALSDVQEFVAEFYANPDFKLWLKSIKNQENNSENLWTRILNFLRELFGIGGINSLYDNIDNVVTSEKYKQYSINSVKETPEQLINAGVIGFNSFWYHSAETIRAHYEYNPSLIALFEQLPNYLKEVRSKLQNINKSDAKIQEDISAINSLLNDYYRINKEKDHEDYIKSVINILQSGYLMAQDINNDLQELVIAQKIYEDSLLFIKSVSPEDPQRIEIEANLEKMHQEEDKRILVLFTLSKQAEALSALDPLITEISGILSISRYSDLPSKRFIAQISLIQNIRDQVQLQYLRLAKKATIQRFAISETDSVAYQTLKETIDKNTELRDNTTDPVSKNIYNNRILEAEKSLKLIPTSDILKAMLSGQLPDASAVDLQLVSMALNGNGLIQRATGLLQDYDTKLAARRNEKTNLIATWMNKFKDKKNLITLRDMNNQVTKHISVPVKRVVKVEEDDKGELKFITEPQLAFIGDYDPQYITDFDILNHTISYLEEKRITISREADNELALKKINEQIDEARENKNKFIKEHSERPNKEEFYLHKDILAEKVSGIGDSGERVTTSLGEKYKNIFRELEIRERHKRQTSDPEELIAISGEIALLWTQFKEIGNRFTNLGKLKKGLDYRLYLQAVRYQAARKEAGEYVMTASDEIAYNKALTNLNNDFTLVENQIMREIDLVEKTITNKTQKDLKLDKLNTQLETKRSEYQEALKEIQRITPTQEYFDLKQELHEQINLLKKQILDIPGVSDLLDPDYLAQLKQNLKDNYDKLRELVVAYRDNEGMIDGIAFSSNKPEAVEVVKEIQLLEQAIRSDMRSFQLNLSTLEREELYSLSQKRKKNQLLTNEELTRLEELSALKNKLTKLKSGLTTEQQNSFIDLTIAYQDLFDLDVTEPTAYYKQEKERQISKLSEDLSNEYYDNQQEFLDSHNLTVMSTGAVASKEEDSDGNLVSIIKWPSVQEAILQISAEEAVRDLETTKWYQDNHYLRTVYDKDSETYEERSFPIYIWMHTIPKHAHHIGTPEPTIAFKTFMPKETNPNFELIAPDLAKPKTSSKYYGNKQLTELKKNPELFELYTNLRSFYYQTQEDTGMGVQERLYDILPSIPKHDQELKINLTNILTSGKLKSVMNNVLANTFGRVDEDSQVIQGGSISKRFKTDKVIPYRFNNQMSTDKQSEDLFTMLLIYDGINSDVFNRRSLEEVFQTALKATEDLKKTRDLTQTLTGGALNFTKIKEFFSNKGSQPITVREELTGESVLHQTLRHILDTYIYGETKVDSSFVLGGKVVDGHKVASSIKKLASRMIFGMKWHGPTKNYLSNMLNGLNQAGIFYTHTAYSLAAAQAYIELKDVLLDYRKLGNKSEIGQALDYFKVLQGGVITNFGDKVMWSALGEATDGKNLTVIKNSAELLGQLTTFLAISKSNQVQLGDKLVDFHEAFEVKDGKFQMKPGAIYKGNPLTQKDINQFVKKIGYVNRRLNGAFRDLEKSKIEKHALGGLLFYLNGFVIPGIKARYGKEIFLDEGDIVIAGYYREFFKFMIEGFKNDFSFRKVFKSKSPAQQQSIYSFMREFSMAMFFVGLVNFLSGGEGDTKEELKKNSALHNWFFAFAIGVGSEIQTFIPIPGLGVDEGLRKLTNPFAAFRQVVILGKILDNMVSAIIPGGSDGRYKVQGIKDGLHDKGDLKFIADLISLKTGFNLREFDSVEKVLQLKRSQILR